MLTGLDEAVSEPGTDQRADGGSRNGTFTGTAGVEREVVGPEDPEVVRASWQLLKERGATHVYAGHGPIRPLPSLDV